MSNEWNLKENIKGEEQKNLDEGSTELSTLRSKYSNSFCIFYEVPLNELASTQHIWTIFYVTDVNVSILHEGETAANRLIIPNQVKPSIRE